MNERKLNIAIADDDETVLDYLVKILKSEDNLNVVGISKDGEDLINVTKNNQVDVLLADIFMPVIDGSGAINMIKSDPNISNKPFCILMSPIGDETIIKRSFGIGADYYLMKPFHQKMLLNVIRTSCISIDCLRYSCIYDENTMYNKVSETLKLLGVPANMKGYSCLREAICICLKDRSKLSGVTKELYPEVGRLCGIDNPERTMRYAIETVYSRGNIEYIHKIFGYSDPNKDRPTVTEFLATMVDHILLGSKKI